MGKLYQNNNTGLLVFGLLFGAAVGVAAGFLLAPQAGERTREFLRQGIATGADRIRELRRDVEAEAEEVETGEAGAD